VYEEPARSGPTIALSRSALQHNVRAVKNNLQRPTKLAPIIKANAYGHGRGQVAEVLASEVDALCVAEPDDALYLSGLVSTRIICLGPTYGAELRSLVQAGVEVAVSDRAAVIELRPGDRVHVAVDTGLSRLGIRPADAEELADRVLASGAVVAGVFCHVSGADRGDWTDVEREVSILRGLQIDGPRHCGGSSLSLMRPDLVGEISRPGLAALGYYPQPHMRGQVPLVPSLTLLAPVVETRTVPQGSAIGYSGIRAASETVVATLGIGVHHGLDPRWGEAGGYVMLGNVRCPLIEGPMLDYTLVDASGVGDLVRGSMATVIGPGVDVGTMAARIGDSEEHLLVRLNSEVRRVLAA
jgi:alanine racemase